ncbi:MAG: FAD-dependent oxidoreductase, partial [Gammaproteobacteria bacterium]|nr:FAD-dependent oxidoreductase [Gammaproteobacteria bacterium]
MEYDAVIVGAGPAGLACAIRLKQLKPALNVCVLEKGSAVGAHSLSGAVLEPGPLEALLPEWRSEYPGMKVPATEDEFRILTRTGSFKPVPDFLVRLLPRSLTYSTPF